MRRVAQEFECQFLDVQATLLTYELIAACESLETTASIAPEFAQRRSSLQVDAN